jgi:phosphoglycolate phosphatase-like HAD superfamily hydrolase
LRQGRLGAFSVALTDFDRTLAQLFDAAALQVAYLQLRAFYEQHGVPGELLPDEGDPYSALVRAHAWMRSNLAPRRTVELDRRAARRLARRELRAAGSARLFEGVDHTLRWLRTRGIPVLVVSNNSTRALWRALYACDASNLVEWVIGRRHHFEMDEMKPSPTLIEAALRHVGGIAQQAFFVGDSPSDMDAGRKAGVLTIGVCTGKVGRQELLEAGADACIASFAELPSFRFD